MCQLLSKATARVTTICLRGPAGRDLLRAATDVPTQPGTEGAGSPWGFLYFESKGCVVFWGLFFFSGYFSRARLGSAPSAKCTSSPGPRTPRPRLQSAQEPGGGRAARSPRGHRSTRARARAIVSRLQSPPGLRAPRGGAGSPRRVMRGCAPGRCVGPRSRKPVGPHT